MFVQVIFYRPTAADTFFSFRNGYETLISSVGNTIEASLLFERLYNDLFLTCSLHALLDSQNVCSLIY